MPKDVVKDRARLNERGHEVLDDKPVSLPLRFQRGENITQQVQRLVAGEMSRLAEARGFETFEDANDFDVGDDYDPRSQHEVDEMQEDNYDQDREQYYESKRNPQRPLRAPETPEGRNPETEGALQQSGSSAEERGKGTSAGQ